MQGKAQRVTIYFGESDQHQGRSLQLSLLEFLKEEGALGATVTRAVSGFGARSRIRTASLVELSADLPVKLEWVDAPEQIERLLPEVRRRMDDGLITIEPVEIVQYAGGRLPDPLNQPIATIMRRGVTAVSVDTPIADAVQLLLARGYQVAPVLNADETVAGVLTDGDLLELAGMKARLSLQGDLSPRVLRQQFSELAQQTGAVGDIMSAPAITVREDAPIRQAAQRMLDHRLKRLPVIDAENHLVGLVTRMDLFRLLDYHQPASAPVKPPITGASIGDLMQTDVPVVSSSDGLETILQALEQSRQRRAVVVDAARHVLGIITDGDILERSQHGDDPGLLRRLRGAVSRTPSVPVALPSGEDTAADLMSAPATTVTLETPLHEALDLMIWYGFKRLPVVDDAGRLVGLLGRTSLLQGLMKTAE